jgi:murein L,D-transpeptidase YafK
LNLPLKFDENLLFIEDFRAQPSGWRPIALRKPPLGANDCDGDGTGIVHPLGSFDLIRASLVRALLAPAALAAALALAGCYTEDGSYQIPSRAMKELSPEMISLLQTKNMPKDSPILVRIFKEESELEVWKQDTTGRYELLRVYPICRWSGDIGPKKVEGDRQAPEGFYAITPGLMNPNSNYYLAINIGFPNAYDKANGYSGAFLMIHGDCSSRGCYAMTDEQIGEIYSLARESFLGGQKQFQIQAYPFRLTPENLARHRNNPNMAFWKMLKIGDDHFQTTHLEPKVDVCEKHYVFDAQASDGSSKSLSFSPSGRCPAYEVDPVVAGPANDKQRNDEYQLAQLISRDVPTVPLNNGTFDGGMNKVFANKLDTATYTYDDEGHLHVPPLQPGRLPPVLSSGPSTVASTTGSTGNSSSSSSGFFGNLFGSKANAAPSQGQVASAAPGNSSHSGLFSSLFSSAHDTADTNSDTTAPDTQAPVPVKPKAVAHNVSVHPKQNPDTDEADASKAKATPTPASSAPQKEANVTAPSASNNGTIKGAQPVVPAGSFDNRFGTFQ